MYAVPSPDMRKILHEEECSDTKEGWRFVSRSEFTEVWKKSDPTKPVHLVKVLVHVCVYVSLMLEYVCCASEFKFYSILGLFAFPWYSSKCR